MSIFSPRDPFELMYLKAIVHGIVESGTAFPPSADAAIYGKTPADERRRIERAVYSKAIVYCIGNVETLHQNGHIVDISKAGMGIYTGYPLRPGSTIRFDAVKEGIDYKTGIVRNAILIENNMYRAGLEFV